MAAPLRSVITRKSIKLFWVRKKQEKGGIKVRIYSLCFIQSRLYNIQIIKVIKMVRHQTKKYQISKEKIHAAVSAEMPSRN